MIIRKIIKAFYQQTNNILYSAFLYPSFKSFGKKSKIIKPLIISGEENIEIGDSVKIGYNVWLSAKSTPRVPRPILSIGNGCRIGNFNHIYSTGSIIIENDVLTADKVYISDNLHSYEDINIPIWKQAIKQKNQAIIKSGTWIGENVCIIGATIGKNCVIGANSVVTKDVPDYSVAIGAPARIIKRYNLKLQSWVKTNPDGSFIR